ncbi:GntR family transcriptional regulator [Allorhizobium borbori]|uniref:DNA-binding GntR family transcriptional regulator n=1 Tax=Allorhizobium borbori TaxID=485907 RepID=A0A7W6P2B4_9HYPH|nr:GntR family transcriptional regulator [Allorhizobium borbori]MBB4103671.1 DNA-binding GntR family transcriptional regulator [Allorhizobium borbori]
MKTNGVYKRAYNQCLDLLAGRAPGEVLASEPTLAAQLGVSRTTVRAVIAGLVERGIVGQEGRERRLLRLPSRADYLDSADLEPVADMLERKFMAWMVGPDCHPGGVINGLDLARQFGVSTSAIRECLNKFSHFGLLERQSNGRWRALGLTVDFVEELFDMREVMEFRAVDRFVALPKGHAAWEALAGIEAQHHALLADFDRRYRDFSELDHRFHKLINSVAPNRFFSNIQGVMSAIFHYHYQWNKKYEKERNHVALHEHLAYIAGLRSGDIEKARTVSHVHLETARSTMLASIEIAPA